MNNGKHYLLHIFLINNPVTAIVSRDYPLSNAILSSKNCIAHNYIEEGQIAYKKIKTYNFNKDSKFSTSNLDGLYAESKTKLFRNSAIEFYGLSEDSFPLVNKKYRVILDNFKTLQTLYIPRLIGVKYIGLTCAQRRITDKNSIELMLKKIIDKMPFEGGVIKLHPSFISNKKLHKEIVGVFNKIEKRNIKLCSNNVIIELEMLHDPKIIIGPLTSLEKYATLLNSKFISIKLY